MKKVFIGIPIHRHWYHESQRLLEDNIIKAKGWQLGMLFKVYEESLIQRARQTIFKRFLESDCDFLFFVDDDILLFSPDTINQLVEMNKDIVGGLYICKKPPYNPVYMPFEKQYHDFTQEKHPRLVRFVSTGCMLISKKAAHAMSISHKYPFDCYETTITKGSGENQIEETLYLSEDWAFCDRASKAGFDIWINPKPILGHLGSYAFSINDYYSMLKQQKG